MEQRHDHRHRGDEDAQRAGKAVDRAFLLLDIRLGALDGVRGHDAIDAHARRRGHRAHRRSVVPARAGTQRLIDAKALGPRLRGDNEGELTPATRCST
jgi:hypothetical protein